SDSLGDFAVVWQSNGSAGGDTSSYSVQEQLYDASGAAMGGQFQVNTYTFNGQNRPWVATDPIGKDFVVVWQGIDATDTDGGSISTQRYLPEPALGLGIGATITALTGLARQRRRTR